MAQTRTPARFIAKAKAFVVAHKILSGIAAVILVGGSWWAYGKVTGTGASVKYVLGAVEKGTVVASVSASGQVSTTQSLDVKSKVTGEIVYIGVKPGQKVSAGTLIAEIDPTDAQKAVRDAQTNLQSAQIALDKLKEPADTLTLTQAQNALSQAQTALSQAYNTAQTDVTSTFLDIPDIMTGIQNIDEGYDASRSQWNIDYYRNQTQSLSTSGSSYRDDAYNALNAAQSSYNAAIADYKAINLASADNATTERLLAETNSTTKAIATAVKNTGALIQFYKDQLTSASQTINPVATTQLTTLNGYTSKLNTHLTALLSDLNTLETNKQNLIEKQEALKKTQDGTDELDLASQDLAVTKAQNALTDAQNTLADYYVRAPFGGTIASVPVNKYDQAGSGAIATLITEKQIATLSLNEVDAAKISLGQKATLTFDAIDGLTLTGVVIEIDPVGTVSQGVVSYTVKIAFDTQDARVKPGMTVNAVVQTATHVDVLMVPSSAIKTQNNSRYVQVFSPAITDIGGTQGTPSSIAPQRVQVETGISDDSTTEIVSGLTEGEQIVVRTISGTQTPAATSGTSNRSGAGGPGIRL